MFQDQMRAHDEMFRKMMDDLFPPLPPKPMPQIPKSDKNQYEVGNGMQVVEINEAFNLNFNLGNVIKYVLRTNLKDTDTTLKDLRKAMYYLDREIERVEEKYHEQR